VTEKRVGEGEARRGEIARKKIHGEADPGGIFKLEVVLFTWSGICPSVLHYGAEGVQ
jgi:hypothetical protein